MGLPLKSTVIAQGLLPVWQKPLLIIDGMRLDLGFHLNLGFWSSLIMVLNCSIPALCVSAARSGDCTCHAGRCFGADTRPNHADLLPGTQSFLLHPRGLLRIEICLSYITAQFFIKGKTQRLGWQQKVIQPALLCSQPHKRKFLQFTSTCAGSCLSECCI